MIQKYFFNNIVTFKSRITATNKIYVQKEEISKWARHLQIVQAMMIFINYVRNYLVCIELRKEF